MAEPVAVAWSGGKDSAMALHACLEDPAIDVVTLLTTVTDDGHVTMHEVPEALIADQAAAIGLPVSWVRVPRWPSNVAYDEAMGEALTGLRERGITTVVHGDLHLEDVRAYRDERLARVGMRAVYPNWGEDTAGFMRRFLDLGFRAVVVCVDPAHLDGTFVGRVVDEAFVADLPEEVDPAGERGEYHTFVVDGPDHDRPVPVRPGGTAERDGFWYHRLHAPGTPNEASP